jgi:hypothetical protein
VNITDPRGRKRSRSPSVGPDNPEAANDPSGSSQPKPKRSRIDDESMRGEGQTSQHSPSSPSHVLASNHSNGTTNGASSAKAAAVAQELPQEAVINGHCTSAPRPPRRAQWDGHSREELSRLMIQALRELGYSTSAQALARESGFDLESPTVTAFRSAVLDGRWEHVELLLFGEEAFTRAPQSEWTGYIESLRRLAPSWTGRGLALMPRGIPTDMMFSIRQQKYLELLESRDVQNALWVLRNQLTPFLANTHRLHFLGS